MSKEKERKLWQEKKAEIFFTICAAIILLLTACIAGGLKATILIAAVGISFFTIVRDEILKGEINWGKICITMAAGLLLISMNLSLQLLCTMIVSAMDAWAIFSQK